MREHRAFGRRTGLFIVACTLIALACSSVTGDPGPSATSPPKDTPTLPAAAGPTEPTEPEPTTSAPGTGGSGDLPEGAFVSAAELQGPISGPMQVEVGGQLQLGLYQLVCCTFMEEVEAGVTWSAEEVAGIELDPDSGLLTVGPNVADGTTFQVTATSQSGPGAIEGQVTVFRPVNNPLVGTWREAAQLACGGGEAPPAQPIRELIFFADGTFRVTWMPFEAYVDYGGEYSVSDEGRLRMDAQEINYLPPDFDGEGAYRIDAAGRLILEEVWLGTPPGSAPPGGGDDRCGHIFTGN